MVINNELGITCHRLFEDTTVLRKGTGENNKPQQESWSLAYGLDTWRVRQTDRQTDRQVALVIVVKVSKYEVA
jgi:hypothetical protein